MFDKVWTKAYHGEAPGYFLLTLSLPCRYPVVTLSLPCRYPVVTLYCRHLGGGRVVPSLGNTSSNTTQYTVSYSILENTSQITVIGTGNTVILLLLYVAVVSIYNDKQCEWRNKLYHDMLLILCTVFCFYAILFCCAMLCCSGVRHLARMKSASFASANSQPQLDTYCISRHSGTHSTQHTQWGAVGAPSEENIHMLVHTVHTYRRYIPYAP